MKIYIASKANHRPSWRELRDEGYPINARWIDTDDKFTVCSDGLNYPVLWEMCHQDIYHADVLVCYAELGERHKGSLIEIGMALAFETPVILCGDTRAFEENGTWLNHRNVKHDSASNGDMRLTLNGLI